MSHVKFLLLPCLLLATVALARPPKQPSQPDIGPGGSDYPHDGVRMLGPFGEGAKAFWLFEPDAPIPVSAPVIAFLHGFSAVDAQAYGGWIGHLVRRGNIVIYPVFQTTMFGAGHYTANALAGLKDALRMLRSEPDHVRPEEDNFAFVGHSLGCTISANIIGVAVHEGLPRPKAFIACHAGDTNSMMPLLPSHLQSPALMPDLLMLVVVGAGDYVAGDTTGRQIFTQSSGVKPSHKNLIIVQSDHTGSPGLVSSHFAPLAAIKAFSTGARLSIGLEETSLPGPLRSALTEKINKAMFLPRSGGIDALDFYGYWKWLDALTDAAFYGTHREWALGDTPEQRYLGTWSDGRPVKPAIVELGK